MTQYRTGEAARAIGVSPPTLRAWERRFGWPVADRRGGTHRHYDREVILAIRDAIGEGLMGAALIDRARELAESPRYQEPPALRERMRLLEERLDRVIVLLEEILRRAQWAP